MDTPKFPHHRDCETLTGITLDHLPRDGSLGRVRRFAKGAFLWRPDGAADRIYFLRKGRIVVSTARLHERPVGLRTIEPNQPFGESRSHRPRRTGVSESHRTQWSKVDERITMPTEGSTADASSPGAA